MRGVRCPRATEKRQQACAKLAPLKTCKAHRHRHLSLHNLCLATLLDRDQPGQRLRAGRNPGAHATAHTHSPTSLLLGSWEQREINSEWTGLPRSASRREAPPNHQVHRSHANPRCYFAVDTQLIILQSARTTGPCWEGPWGLSPAAHPEDRRSAGGSAAPVWPLQHEETRTALPRGLLLPKGHHSRG